LSAAAPNRVRDEFPEAVVSDLEIERKESMSRQEAPVECRDVATYTSAQIRELGSFRLLTTGDELPVFAFTLRHDVTNYSVSTSPQDCGNVAGRYPHTPSPPIARTLLRCASWCVTEQVAGDGRPLVGRPRTLPRMQQRVEPIRGADAKGFDHATAQRKT
jgi:glutamate decarboxylase